jgi:pre-mRNA-splicing factor ISY1
MFNRFIKGKQEALKGEKDRRPYLATECKDLNAADKWRQEILREIGKKVMEIQNAGLGEHRLRDLNDEINKLIREKSHWEKRILDLGGPNYVVQGRRIADADGKDAKEDEQKGTGYRYFGAAKQLPVTPEPWTLVP